MGPLGRATGIGAAVVGGLGINGLVTALAALGKETLRLVLEEIRRRDPDGTRYHVALNGESRGGWVINDVLKHPFRPGRLQPGQLPGGGAPDRAQPDPRGGVRDRPARGDGDRRAQPPPAPLHGALRRRGRRVPAQRRTGARALSRSAIAVACTRISGMASVSHSWPRRSQPSVYSAPFAVPSAARMAPSASVRMPR